MQLNDTDIKSKPFNHSTNMRREYPLDFDEEQEGEDLDRGGIDFGVLRPDEPEETPSFYVKRVS